MADHNKASGLALTIPPGDFWLEGGEGFGFFRCRIGDVRSLAEAYREDHAEVKRLRGEVAWSESARGEALLGRDAALQRAEAAERPWRERVMKLAREIGESLYANGKEIEDAGDDEGEGRCRQWAGRCFSELAEMMWMEDDSERDRALIERLQALLAKGENDDG